PQTVQPNRDHRGAGMLSDQLIAPPQAQERPGTRQLAFGKKANNFARSKLFGGTANGGTRMLGVDRNAANNSQEAAQERFVIEFLIDNVADGPGTSELQDDGIDPGDVVGQQEESALG